MRDSCRLTVAGILNESFALRSLWFSLVRHAIFGFDTIRFGAMLGTFTAIYKFLINALPILVPAVNPRRYSSSAVDDEETDIDMLESGRSASRLTVEVPLAERRARLSLSTHAQMMIVRKKTRRWHAALAGAVAGALAIVWEKRNRRGVIAQQMFVRYVTFEIGITRISHTTLQWPSRIIQLFCLEAQYTRPSRRSTSILCRVWTFSYTIHPAHTTCSCGQILYAFLLRPDTLPRSYSSW